MLASLSLPVIGCPLFTKSGIFVDSHTKQRTSQAMHYVWCLCWQANHASPVMCLSWWQQLVIKKKICFRNKLDVWFYYLIQSFLHYTSKNRISKVINFVYSTELEKYVFRLVKRVERRRNSKFPCRKVLEKKVHLSNHGWTQKQVNKADKASILLIKYWRQLQVKRMKKG